MTDAHSRCVCCIDTVQGQDVGVVSNATLLIAFSCIMSIEIMLMKSLVFTTYAAVKRFFAFALPIWPKMMTANELLWSSKAIE